jgi:hypothetical protein
MTMKAFLRHTLLITSLAALIPTSQANTLPIFDSHSHYSLADSRVLSPAQIISRYDKYNVIGAVISSTPTSKAELLYQYAPKRIIPFLSLYKTKANKPNWMLDLNTLSDIETQLDAFPYQGIGEFHIFKQDTYSPVLKRIIEIADERNLMLQIHGDAEIVDRIFEISPNVQVIWAHLGTQPTPDFLASLLKRHPQNLYIDTSVRDGEFFDDQGRLTPEWKDFFIQHQDRLLAAIDTFSTLRWLTVGHTLSKMRRWLTQLPPGVAHKIAYQNALKLFDRPDLTP